MTDYIEREAAIVPSFRYLLPNGEKSPPVVLVKTLLHSIPAADVRPVRKGKWIEDCDYNFRCSVCGDRRIVSNGNPLDVANGWNFCPTCGADMREES